MAAVVVISTVPPPQLQPSQPLAPPARERRPALLLASASGAVASFSRRLPHRSSNCARLSFGSWLALEFQLGADIVSTTISPSGQHLIQLGVVAVIRTFLNVFLAPEINAEEALVRPAALGQGDEPIASPGKP